MIGPPFAGSESPLRDAEVLETLAHVASGEVALQAAAQDGIHCAALAQALQESLLPPD